MDIDYQRIGYNIRRNRKEKNLTQKQIAEKLGCTAEHFSHIEKGNRRIQLETLTALCEILDVSFEDLLDNATSIEISRSEAASTVLANPCEKDFIKMLRGMSDKKAYALLEICQKILLIPHS